MFVFVCYIFWVIGSVFVWIRSECCLHILEGDNVLSDCIEATFDVDKPPLRAGGVAENNRVEAARFLDTFNQTSTFSAIVTTGAREN